MSGKVSIEIKDPQEIVNNFIKQDLKEVLDLSKCDLQDKLAIQLLEQVRKQRKIRGLKLSHNCITDKGFEEIVKFIGSTTNLNLAYNKLTEEALNIIIKNRDLMSPLRIVNLSGNDFIEKKCKGKI